MLPQQPISDLPTLRGFLTVSPFAPIFPVVPDVLQLSTLGLRCQLEDKHPGNDRHHRKESERSRTTQFIKGGDEEINNKPVGK